MELTEKLRRLLTELAEVRERAIQVCADSQHLIFEAGRVRAETERMRGLSRRIQQDARLLTSWSRQARIRRGFADD